MTLRADINSIRRDRATRARAAGGDPQIGCIRIQISLAISREAPPLGTDVPRIDSPRGRGARRDHRGDPFRRRSGLAHLGPFQHGAGTRRSKLRGAARRARGATAANTSSPTGRHVSGRTIRISGCDGQLPGTNARLGAGRLQVMGGRSRIRHRVSPRRRRHEWVGSIRRRGVDSEATGNGVGSDTRPGRGESRSGTRLRRSLRRGPSDWNRHVGGRAFRPTSRVRI